jgi:hypothetical protein
MTTVPTMHSEPGNWLYLENFYHGDHDEDWIVARDDAQREIARYSPRCMSAIIFAESPPEGRIP